MTVELRLWDAAAAAALVDAVWPVYAEAFGTTDRAHWEAEVWDRHRMRADYRLVTAHRSEAPGAELVGFAWGYTGELGQYFPDRILGVLGEPIRPWLGGHFEFVELAVASAARGHGAGRHLHDALLRDLPHDRAILCTSSDPADPAVRLYASRGWRRLGLLDEQTQIMGLRRPGSV